MRDWLSSTAASPSPTWSRILTADFMDDFLEQTFHLFLYVTVKRLPCQEISKFLVTANMPPPNNVSRNRRDFPQILSHTPPYSYPTRFSQLAAIPTAYSPVALMYPMVVLEHLSVFRNPCIVKHVE